MDIKRRLSEEIRLADSMPTLAVHKTLCRDAFAEIERLETELRDSNKALTVTLRLSPDIAEVVSQIASAARKGEDS